MSASPKLESDTAMIVVMKSIAAAKETGAVLQQIEALGHDAYPREFRWTDTAAALLEQYGQTPGTELEANKREVRVAGRIVSLRLMGKAGFAHLQGSGKRKSRHPRASQWRSTCSRKLTS